MPINENTKKQLTDLVTQNPVVLFMKGNRRMPMCGFSAQVVRILDGLVPEYKTVDVLSAPEIRDGIKEFSDWPTLPQLYIGGEFVGGCDIVREMFASGELQKLISGQPAAQAGTSSSAAAAPPAVLQITAQEMKEKLTAGQVKLFDVRTPQEHATASIKEAELLDQSGQARLLGLDRKTPIGFVCHHGMRSRAAAEWAISQGFEQVFNLQGGIDAWSQSVDPSVPRY